MGPKVRAKLVIEIAGRPEEHVKKSIDLVAEKFSELKTHNLLSSKMAPVVSISENLFSGFIELDVEFNNILALTGAVFDWMPSSVEIMEPEEFKWSGQDLTDFLNELASRLHNQDAVVKTLTAQKAILERKLNALKQPKYSVGEREVKPGEVI